MSTPRLDQLQQPDAFLRRHLGPDAREEQAMLDALGLSSREELIVQTVPPAIRLNRELDLPAALDEQGALAQPQGLRRAEPAVDQPDRHGLPRHPSPPR